MKTFLQIIAFIIITLSAGMAAPRELAGSKPNIIFILADDLGYGDLGCYGQKTLGTPRLDRMAAEGMRFTRHYAGSTVCAPSRCVLMTGLHTGHGRVRGNGEGQLKLSDFTVAELLKKAGYATACIGKWGIGNPPPIDDPERNGFDSFYGYVNMFHAHNFFPEFLYRNGKKEALRNVLQEKWKNEVEVPGPQEGRGVAARKIDYVPGLLAKDVLRTIRERAGSDAPFFLYYALNIPHANNEGGKDPDGLDGMEVPGHGEFAKRDWPNAEKGFATMIRHIDNDVGAILDLLVEKGIAGDTVVFFSSDNGPHQEGGHSAEFFDSNGALRGTKRDLYDGGVRVPLIAWWPGAIEAGIETDHISAFQDLMPTVAALAGVKAPENTDGISFLPTLAGDAASQEKHDALYWEFQEQGGKRAVIAGGWKGIRLQWEKNPDGPLELYRLEDDIGEVDNVAAGHPEVVAELEEIMRREHGDAE